MIGQFSLLRGGQHRKEWFEEVVLALQSTIANHQSSINRGLVVIGLSTGGLHALSVLLASLPEDFPLPVVVVQHREKGSDEDRLTWVLRQHGHLAVKEPEDKEVIRAGNVYLAPPDYHLLIEGDHFALSTEAPLWYARPSVDILFESAANAYGKNVIGIVLTGANEDGAQGLATIRKRGGLAIVQDPKTAESPKMPEAAIAATKVDQILPLEEIGPFLVNIVGSNK